MEVKEITHLLEDVEEGTAFVVIRGRTFDNLPDVPYAIKRGAVLLITPERLPYDTPQTLVKDPRKAATELADKVYPGWRFLNLVGITGTNGKTTTSFLIRNALRKMGYPPALIGTVVWDDLHRVKKATLTTPEAFYIRRILGRAARKGAKFGVMEVSSIGLAQGRVEGMEFAVGVLTSIGRDHLDYHGSFEAYIEAKALLFSRSRKALINADSPYAPYFLSAAKGEAYTYGEGKGDFPFRILETSIEGTVVEILGRRVRTPLIGKFNAQNLTAAFGSLVLLGFKPDTVAQSLDSVSGPPGRLERVFAGKFHVFVDYAHTPDAIDRVLSVLRPYARRLIAVFGAGGNRDRGKRPEMAKAVERWADIAVLTSDNPRWEDPMAIIEDIRRGFKEMRPVVIPDRREAIGEALAIAGEGDVVVVLGKGHEDYQEIEGKRLPFSDTEVIRGLLGLPTPAEYSP